jgi:hypothetical protein
MFAPFTLAYKMHCIIFPPAAVHIGTMHPCEWTLGYIDFVPSDAEEEHSSPLGAKRSIIDLAGPDSEEEHAPADELDGMQKEDLQEHMVVEESIASAWREEAEVHRAVEESFDDRLRA